MIEFDKDQVDEFRKTLVGEYIAYTKSVPIENEATDSIKKDFAKKHHATVHAKRRQGEKARGRKKAKNEKQKEDTSHKQKDQRKYTTSCLNRIREYIISAPRGTLLQYDQIVKAVAYDTGHKGASMTSFKRLLIRAMRELKIEWVVTHGVGVSLNASNNIITISKVSQRRVKCAITRNLEVHQNLSRNVKLVEGSTKFNNFEILRRKSITLHTSASKIWTMNNSGG